MEPQIPMRYQGACPDCRGLVYAPMAKAEFDAQATKPTVLAYCRKCDLYVLPAWDPAPPAPVTPKSGFSILEAETEEPLGLPGARKPQP